MAKLIPYIFADEARKQAEYYVKALGGVVVTVKTFAEAPNSPEAIRDRVMHLELSAAGLTFYLADHVDSPVVRGSGMDLTLVYSSEEEAQAAFDGLAAGGTVKIPFQRMFWGTSFGRVVDAYGVGWQISTEA